MTKTLTVFDLDETLVAGDTAMLWNQFLVERNLVTEPNFLERDKILMGRYARGELDMQEYLQFSLAPLASFNTEAIDALVGEFVAECVVPLFYPDGVSLLKQLKQQQGEQLIISATATFIVKQVATQLGIEDALGIDLVLDANCYTSKIAGIPTFREGKVARLKQWLEKNDQRFDSIHFYSDSINDLPLLDYCDSAFVVNPCPKLQTIAQQRGWQELQWLAH